MDKFLQLLKKHQNLLSVIAGVAVWRYDNDLGRILLSQGL